MATSDESKQQTGANLPDIPPDFNLDPDPVLNPEGAEFELPIAALGAPKEIPVPSFPTIDLDLEIDPVLPISPVTSPSLGATTSAFPTIDLNLDLGSPETEVPSLVSGADFPTPTLEFPAPASELLPPVPDFELPEPDLIADQPAFDFSGTNTNLSVPQENAWMPNLDFSLPDLSDDQDAFGLGTDELGTEVTLPTSITTPTSAAAAIGADETSDLALDFPDLDLSVDQPEVPPQLSDMPTESEEDDFSFPDLNLSQDMPTLDFATPGFEVDQPTAPTIAPSNDSSDLGLELEGLLAAGATSTTIDTPSTTQAAVTYSGVDDPWTESQSSNSRQMDSPPLQIASLPSDRYESPNYESPSYESPSYESPDLAAATTAQTSASSYPDPDRERLNAALGWEEKIAIGVAVAALGTVTLLSAGRQFLKPNPPEPTSTSSQLSTPTTNLPGSPAPIGQSPASSLSVKNSPTANPAQPSTDKSAGSTSPKPGQNQPAPSPQGGAPVAVPFNTGQVPKPEPDANPTASPTAATPGQPTTAPVAATSPASPAVASPSSPAPTGQTTPKAGQASPSPSGTAPAGSTPFKDVSGKNWASPFIATLVQQQFLAGTPDGRFEPNRSVTRAEFAALVSKAFQQEAKLPMAKYKDVKADYWAGSVIDEATQTAFLRGYPGQTFRPQNRISRLEVLLSLVNGLGLQPPAKPSEVIRVYQDRRKIPSWAIASVAAATEAGLVVNYPNAKFLNPNEPATRSDATAMIYQALAKQGKVQPIASPYVVKKTK